jgi:lipopolysaccharide transport system permease protein
MAKERAASAAAGRVADGARQQAKKRRRDREPAATAGASVDGAAPRRPPAGALRVIEPPAPGLRRYFAAMRRHRPAFRYFLLRYMRKRYGRTFFGYLWFVLPVLLPLFLGALVVGGILGVGIPGIPYMIYFCVALGAWLLFSQTAYLCTRSLEISRSEIRRVYVPRLIPLMAAVTLPAITFLVYVVILACTTVFYIVTRGEFYLELRLPETLLAPCGLAMLVVLAWVSALFFSPLAPRARDVRRLSGYALGIWYFLTPVMYPISEIPSGWRFLASLNPATAPIELVKDGMLDVGHVTTLGLVSYFGVLVVLSVAGLRVFLPQERRDMAFY